MPLSQRNRLLIDMHSTAEAELSLTNFQVPNIRKSPR